MKKKRNQRSIQQHMQREIREMISIQGFAIRQVLSDGLSPAFAYTVGLDQGEACFLRS